MTEESFLRAALWGLIISTTISAMSTLVTPLTPPTRSEGASTPCVRQSAENGGLFLPCEWVFIEDDI